MRVWSMDKLSKLACWEHCDTLANTAIKCKSAWQTCGSSADSAIEKVEYVIDAAYTCPY